LKSPPPRIRDVKIYFNQQGMNAQEAVTFFKFYEEKLWISKKGNYFNNWKHLANQWIISTVCKKPLLYDRIR
jgi:hypothetical protein